MRSLVATLAAFLLSAGAASAVTYQFQTPIAGDTVPVTLQLTDVAGGNAVDVTVSIPAGQGDLLGLFGNVVSAGVVPSMAVTSATGIVTQWQFLANQVWKVGGGNVMSPVQNWDWGLRFARNGSSGGAITSASFRLTGTGLSVAQLTGAANQGWVFGVRIQGTLPQGSAKIGMAAGTPPVSGPPTIAINSPANGALLASSPVSVTGTVTSGATVSVNGVAASVAGATWTASLPLVDGPHTLTATATNASGSANASVNATVDTTPPVVTITSPANGTATITGMIVVTGTVADASPIASFTVNGQAVTLTAGAFSTTVPLGIGANPITATAIDAAGHSGSASVSVTRSTAPTVTIASPANGALTSAASIAVTGAVSGTSPVSVSVNGVAAVVTGGSYSASVPLSEGANTLVATASNAFGNAAAQVSVTRDSTPPLVAITSPPNGLLTTAASLGALGSVTDASPITALTVNGQATPLSAGAFSTTVSLSLGANTITASATDAAGNTGSDSVLVTRGDAPAIAITSPANGLLTSVTPIPVTGTVTGTPPIAVAVNGVVATVTGTTFTALVALTEGANTLTAGATSAFGAASTSVSVTLDTTPPIVTIATPANGAQLSATPVAVAGSVADANPIAAITLNGSPLGPGNAFSASANLVQGSNTLTVTATDAVGLVGSASVEVVFAPPGALVIDITSPAPMTVVYQNSVEVSGTLTDATALVDVNGVAATVTGTSFAASGVPLELGSNALVATARRGAETATDRVTVVYATALNIQIESPLDGATVNTPEIDVSGTVDDPTAFVTVNGVVASVDAAGSFLARGVRLQPGPNELVAVAENTLGGRGTDMVTVTRQDDGAPKLRIGMIAGREHFAFNFSSDLIIADDVASFRAELEAFGDSPAAYAPAIDIVATDPDFVPLYVFVFADHAGDVSLPAAADFGTFDLEPLRPIGEFANELTSLDLSDPSIPGRLLPWDFAPTHFALFLLGNQGGPE